MAFCEDYAFSIIIRTVVVLETSGRGFTAAVRIVLIWDAK